MAKYQSVNDTFEVSTHDLKKKYYTIKVTWSRIFFVKCRSVSEMPPPPLRPLPLLLPPLNHPLDRTKNAKVQRLPMLLMWRVI